MSEQSSTTRKCAVLDTCKKIGLVKCDGCSLRYCSDHFISHRRDLETRMDVLFLERDAFYDQLTDNPEELTKALASIDSWEHETLAHVKNVANNARKCARSLIEARKTNEEFEHFSAELRHRKDTDDYIEQDLDRLKEELNQIKRKLLSTTNIDISFRAIDWSRIILVHLMEHKATHNFFRDGSLLTLKQEMILNEFVGNPQQRWELIFRGTRDGFSQGRFINICADQGPTMTIIAANNCLFGGYTSVSWQNTGTYVWSNDEKAFLFTLTNPHGIEPTKYPIMSPGKSAIRSTGKFGPTFGSYDLCIHTYSNINYHSNCDFPKNYIDTTGFGNLTFTGTTNFATTEIEVYRQVN